MKRKFDLSFPNLIQAWQDSRQADKYGREQRQEMVRQYVGNHWAEQGTSEDVPLNLISLYVGITSRQLIPKVPRFLLSTFDRSHKAAVQATQDWGNQELERMKFRVTARRLVIDGLFGLAVARVALATPSESAARGWGQNAGEPIISRIDREDYAWDSFAGDFSECAWKSHSYRVPLTAVREHKGFSRYRKDLAASLVPSYDETGQEKIGLLSRSYYGATELEEMVDLVEYYCPRHRAIITMYLNQGGQPSLCEDGKPLGDQPWVGPETGPYYELGYGWVPGNALPKGPVQDLVDLHMWANQDYRKAIGASTRTKELTVFRDAAGAERASKANDGDTIFMEDPKEIGQVVYGGQHTQLLLGTATVAKDLFSTQGGNLELMGGRQTQAKTATQEKLLNENAGAGVVDYQETSTNYFNDLIGGLCWYWWKHPHKVMESVYSVPGLPRMQAVRQVHPRGAVDRMGRPHALRRDADYSRIQARIDTYSLGSHTPQSKLQFIRGLVMEMAPMLPLLQQQDMALDLNFLMRKVAEYGDEPDVIDLFTVRDAPQQDGATELPHTQTIPSQTERTYNRVSSSEKTPQGQDQSMVAQLMTGNSQGGKNGKPSMMGA